MFVAEGRVSAVLETVHTVSGKDTVYFLSEKENKIPSTVKIPTRDDLEENRSKSYI